MDEPNVFTKLAPTTAQTKVWETLKLLCLKPSMNCFTVSGDYLMKNISVLQCLSVCFLRLSLRPWCAHWSQLECLFSYWQHYFTLQIPTLTVTWQTSHSLCRPPFFPSYSPLLFLSPISLSLSPPFLSPSLSFSPSEFILACLNLQTHWKATAVILLVTSLGSPSARSSCHIDLCFSCCLR